MTIELPDNRETEAYVVEAITEGCIASAYGGSPEYDRYVARHYHGIRDEYLAAAADGFPEDDEPMSFNLWLSDRAEPAVSIERFYDTY